MKSEDLFWRSYLNIENEVLKLTDYVYITDKDKGASYRTYSIESANLLVRIAVQIESISKKIYDDILKLMDPQIRAKPIYNKPEKEIYFDFDCTALINKTFHSDKKVVNIVSSRLDLTDEKRKIYPLKCGEISDNAKWNKSYQAVKHDYVDSLYRGNVRNVIYSCAALFLLNVYNQFMTGIAFHNMTRKEISQIDYSFGSRLFTIDKPQLPSKVNEFNVVVSSESPFVVKMDDLHFAQFQFKQGLNSENRKRNIDRQIGQNQQEYDSFLTKLNCGSSFALDKYQAYYIWKFKKAAPNTLPFDKRKEAFLALDDVKQYIASDIDYINLPNEINETNIDKIIDQVGFSLGMTYYVNDTAPLLGSLLWDMYIEIDKSLW